MHSNHMRPIFVLLAVTLLIALVTSGAIENRHTETVTVSTSTLAGSSAGVENGSITCYRRQHVNTRRLRRLQSTQR